MDDQTARSRCNPLTAKPDLYVIALSFLGFTVIGAYGNLAAIDAYFLATSAATVSGLTTFGPSPVFLTTISTDVLSKGSM